MTKPSETPNRGGIFRGARHGMIAGARAGVLSVLVGSVLMLLVLLLNPAETRWENLAAALWDSPWRLVEGLAGFLLWTAVLSVLGGAIGGVFGLLGGAVGSAVGRRSGRRWQGALAGSIAGALPPLVIAPFLWIMGLFLIVAAIFSAIGGAVGGYHGSRR